MNMHKIFVFLISFAFSLFSFAVAVLPGADSVQMHVVGSNWSSVPAPVETIRAFPGCEGVGCDTIAGRGGSILKVTNLNDSGAGSFRAAVEATVPRIVVFETSGIINLTSNLLIDDPFLTVAGQTSPNGIIVAGRTTIVNTHDVVIRHMRFRTGLHNNGGNVQNSRSMEVTGDGNAYYPNQAYNVVLDHNSFSWSGDQGLTIENDAYDVTVSWNYIGEPLDDAAHAFSLFYWGRYTQPSRKYSAHHNVTSHSRNRNPEVNYNGMIDYVNNVNYNASFGAAFSILAWSSPDSCATCLVANIEHNFNKLGPASSGNTDKALAWIQDPLAADPANPLVFVEGNIGSQRTSQAQAEENALGTMVFSPSFGYSTPSDPDYYASVPFDFPDITTTTMSTVYAQTIVDTAGATKPFRDAVDTRLALDYTNGTGGLKTTISYPADWPDLATGAPSAPADTDNDGMADGWEIANSLNVGVDDSAAIASGEIYTNIERYINELGGDS